jgi:hypothetical protein
LDGCPYWVSQNFTKKGFADHDFCVIQLDSVRKEGSKKDASAKHADSKRGERASTSRSQTFLDCIQSKNYDSARRELETLRGRPEPAGRGLPEYEQLLEMRLGRDDTDLSDVRFLIDRLGLSEAATPEEKLFSQSKISFSLQPSHHFDY